MRTRILGLAATAALLGAPGADAQVTLGPTLAWETDLDLGIGATLGAPLPAFGTGFGVMADFLIFFPDGPRDYVELNGNLTYDFPLPESTVVPFVLAGLTFARASDEVLGERQTDTDLRLNLGGGLEFSAGRMRPSAGVRVELGDGDAAILFFSLPFALGG